MACRCTVFLLLALALSLLHYLPLASGSRAAADVCTFSASQFYPAEQIEACFSSLPFNETVRDQTLDVLERAMEFYAFLDIAADPPDPEHFFPAVPLQALFAKLRTVSFASDFLFHTYLRQAYIQLHDAHTMYYYPECYASFSFYQPFNLIAYVDSQNPQGSSKNAQQKQQKQRLVVSRYGDADVVAHYARLGVDVKDYVGAEVVAIQGIPAVQYVTQFATNEVGSSKDPGVRFNIALNIPGPYSDFFFPAGYGAWLGLLTTRKSHYLPFTFDDLQMQWSLLFPNGTAAVVTFPWLGSTDTAYPNSQAFRAAYQWSQPDYTDCPTYVPTPDNSGCGVDKRLSGAGKAQRTQSRVVDLLADQNNVPEGPVPIVPIANSSLAGVGMWALGNQTLVWHLNTFEPASCQDYIAVAEQGFLYAQQHRLGQLIIDLTGNGGGIFCLARSTLSWLFPTQQNWGPTDMPWSPAAQNMTDTAVANGIEYTQWSPSFYQNEQNQQLASNDTGFIRGAEHTRGGKTRPYSELIHVSSESEECGYLPEINTYTFAPEKILILTQGFCGSSCALFAQHLHNYESVRTVVLGGTLPLSNSQQYTSFPGLEVLETPCWYQLLDTLQQHPDDLQCQDCTAPRRFLTSAGYRFCNREIYGPLGEDGATPPSPLEYTWSPATYRMEFLSPDEVEFQQLIWSRLLPLFE